MAWKVKWTLSAWEDLKASADFIAKDSSVYASAFVLEVRDAARSLARFTKRGHVVPEISDPSVRELFVGNHRLIYLVKKHELYILSVIHGSRNLWALWKSEGQSKFKKSH